MKKIKSIGLFIFSIISFYAFSQTISPTSAISDKADSSQIEISSISSAPVTIFYGLNESHSNDWAQCTTDGLIGISYYNKYTQNLIYKSIQNDGTENEEIITSGANLEISVLLFDSNSKPHVFVAQSSDSDQTITHYYKNDSGLWVSELVISFLNEGGKFIYELSADLGPNDSIHLLALKTRSNPDSDDYYYAFTNSHLYHITKVEGIWQKDLIGNYDTVWTLDEYSKSFNRQDIKVDSEGFVHVVFGEQINYSSKLCYANNKTGSWEIETALNYLPGTRDDAGWFPSLGINENGIPSISCSYIGRVLSGSALYAKLIFLTRNISGEWTSEMLTTDDDGYYGADGRDYTGGLTHLVFDKDNNPNIIFTDIASRHTGMQNWNLGNIRYAVKKEGIWDISTIYRQPLPIGFFNATEMYGMCLLISENADKIQIIGQELTVNSSSAYIVSLIHKTVGTTSVPDILQPSSFQLHNYPNPFSNSTLIQFELYKTENVKVLAYNTKGEIIVKLVDQKLDSGSYSIPFNTTNLNSGIYFCKLITANSEETIKMVLIK